MMYIFKMFELVAVGIPVARYHRVIGSGHPPLQMAVISFESVKLASDNISMPLWFSLGAQTTKLIHDNIHVGEVPQQFRFAPRGAQCSWLKQDITILSLQQMYVK
jgi:hypothetical protein